MAVPRKYNYTFFYIFFKMQGADRQMRTTDWSWVSLYSNARLWAWTGSHRPELRSGMKWTWLKKNISYEEKCSC